MSKGKAAKQRLCEWLCAQLLEPIDCMEGTPMKVLVRCLKSDFAVCPACGSKNIVGMEKENCHCGQCGQAMEVVFVNKVMNNEEPEPEDFFMQMSLFDDEF